MIRQASAGARSHPRVILPADALRSKRDRPKTGQIGPLRSIKRIKTNYKARSNTDTRGMEHGAVARRLSSQLDQAQTERARRSLAA
ncbi:hypothetical protein, partial [Streptomyces albidoflavus]|uniref:hypothetical protein n=1 Tax=Streptomyces albidoflavus TaxID=1886 RepID=UPI001C5395B7